VFTDSDVICFILDSREEFTVTLYEFVERKGNNLKEGFSLRLLISFFKWFCRIPGKCESSGLHQRATKAE